MNVLKEIESQINAIKEVDNSAYLDAIFTHIERAELYYKNGVMDSSYFNDVIYRSNQAYEGALKESYKVLAGMSSDEVMRKSPNEIERFFETQNVFKERVLQLFKNYRQEWRNKSTHDYKLFFDDSEAFIALTSVTSFVHLLLKQIQEKVSYIAQQKRLEMEANRPLQAIADDSISAYDSLISVISRFAEEATLDYTASGRARESQVVGLLHAYLEFALSTFRVESTPDIKLGEKRYVSPDFIIESGEEKFIIELKGQVGGASIMQAGISQLLFYMEAANIYKGILYFINPKPEGEASVSKVTKMINDIECEITIINGR